MDLRYNLQWTDPNISGPPCIVCQCAHFMDDGAATLLLQSPLVPSAWREFLLHLQNAANKCRSCVFDESAGMARLQQHGHKIQYQRFPSLVAGKGPGGIRRGSLRACFTPGGGKSDYDPALRFLGRWSETDVSSGKQVVFHLGPQKSDRQITVVPATSGRGADRAAQTLP